MNFLVGAWVPVSGPVILFAAVFLTMQNEHLSTTLDAITVKNITVILYIYL